MISAKAAKDISNSSDCGLAEYLEEIGDQIEEAAQEGLLCLTYTLEYAIEDFLLEEIFKSLQTSGYVAKMGKVKCSSGDEYGDNVQTWSEDAIEINWRMA